MHLHTYPRMNSLGCQNLGETIGEENSKWRLRSGSAACPIVCIGSAENSMTLNRRNWRGNFGNADERGWTRIFRKIEQVTKSKPWSNHQRRKTSI